MTHLQHSLPRDEPHRILAVPRMPDDDALPERFGVLILRV